jgi:putative membrane protein insertion efficiency factor
MKTLILQLIRLYQVTISPVLRVFGGPQGGCRFEPTCSEYCLQAVKIHGSVQGLRLGISRICRCHPWGASGEDPVPASIHRN